MNRDDDIPMMLTPKGTISLALHLDKERTQAVYNGFLEYMIANKLAIMVKDGVLNYIPIKE